MGVEGVWKIEMLGPHDWDAVATAFLHNGRYLAASANHYSIGSYEEDGKTFKAEIRITQYGDVRTVFGSKNRDVDTQIEGEIQTVDKIVGTALSTGNNKSYVRVRMTRLGEVD